MNTHSFAPPQEQTILYGADQKRSSRRFLLTAASAAFVSAALPRAAFAAPMQASIPTSGNLLFNVFRHDSQIGTHSLLFTQSGDSLLIRIDVAMHVGIGPLTLYRYRMQAVERWQGSRFVGLNASGDNNGHAFSTEAAAQGDRVAITATNLPRYLTPPGALPLTHWNVQALASPLFNPQTGQMLNEAIHDLGMTALPMPSTTGPAQARQFSLRGEDTIDDWYDGSRWVSLSAIAKDGSKVIYQRA